MIPGLLTKDDNSKALLHSIEAHIKSNGSKNSKGCQSGRWLHRLKVLSRARQNKAQAHKQHHIVANIKLHVHRQEL